MKHITKIFLVLFFVLFAPFALALPSSITGLYCNTTSCTPTSTFLTSATTIQQLCVDAGKAFNNPRITYYTDTSLTFTPSITYACRVYATNMIGTQPVDSSNTSSSSHRVSFSASCPANSSFTNGVCTCNASHPYDTGSKCIIPTAVTCSAESGFKYDSATNTCVLNNDTSCGSNTTTGQSASCTCSGSLYKRFNTSTNSYNCSQSTSNQEDIAMGIIAAFLGLAAANALGLFAGLSACIASVACAVALSVAGLGTLLAGFGVAFDSDSAPATASGNEPIKIRLQPPTSSCPSGKTCVDPDTGAVTPPPDATKNGDGTASYNPPNIPHSITVDPANGTISTKKTNDNGSTDNTVITVKPSNTSEPPVITVRSTNNSPYGTNNGQPVNKIESRQVDYNPKTGTGTTAGTSVKYLSGNDLFDSPPSGTVPIGSGTGTGSGSGSEPSAGTGGGDCDKEPQKCSILTNIKTNLDVNQLNQERVSSVNNGAFLNELNQTADDYFTEVDKVIDDFLQDNTLLDAYKDLLPESPWASINVQRECIFNTQVQDHQFDFNLCKAAEVSHPILTFAGFILVSIASFGLIFRGTE